jgi:hypothetical protein
LEHCGLDQELRTVIRSLYTDLSVSLELNGETVQIKQEQGVFQGDCLSPTLFNIVINLILTRLNKSDITTTYGATVDKDTRLTNAAFADDITLFARSEEHMNNLLTALEDCIRWTKCLKAAPHEFVSRHYTKSGVLQTNFKFGETTIPHSSEGALRLLGRNFWPSLDKKEIKNEFLKQFEDVMDKISKSNVTDEIRLHMVQHFIHAFLLWHLTIYPISVS